MHLELLVGDVVALSMDRWLRFRRAKLWGGFTGTTDYRLEFNESIPSVYAWL
jgi:hypothetical protein